MSEPTKTFLANLALASGIGLAVGVLVACASYPLLQWWGDRKIAGGGQSAGARPDAAVSPADAPSPGVDPSVFLEDEIAETVRRVHFQADR